MATDTSRAAQESTTASLDAAVAYVVDNVDRLDVVEIGEICLPTGSAEAIRCAEIKKIIEEYSRRPADARPLSIAVFGPPGSGKSTLVRSLVATISTPEAFTPLNLSQLNDSKDLAAAFNAKPQDDKKVATRVFFFDEFDAPLNNAPLGWLKWFLAPMQEGEFFAEGKTIPIGKAVFLFAGGTAPSFDEFEKRSSTYTVSARDLKVPDFISRLRGFIDIQGINSIDVKERATRRALALRRQLKKRWPRLKEPGAAPLPIDRKIIRSFLSGGYFVHGVRSMEALLDMCRLADSGAGITVQLPENEVRKLHISRGQLDGTVIGISAGQSETKAGPLLNTLTDRLLQNGAILAYGGDFVSEGTLDTVVTAAASVPDELVEREDKRIRNYLGFPTFLNDRVKTQHEKGKPYVDFYELRTLDDSEIQDLGVLRDRWFPALPLEESTSYDATRHLAWALSLFRMRVRLLQDVDALIVLGGKDEEQSWGRFAGIAEEVMLAIALEKPVYVLGGIGGAARAVGRLLGLDQTIVNRDVCLIHADNAALSSAMAKYQHCFSVPGHARLPVSIAALREFLTDNSIGTDGWPWNGLTLHENRKLFRQPLDEGAADVAVKLIVDGLMRLDWKTGKSVTPSTSATASRTG